MRKKKRTAKKWIDPDDGLELTREMAERADLYYGDRLIRPGKGGPDPCVAKAIKRTRGRPPSDNPKRLVTLRIDADVVAHFRATGPGWQTRINDILRRAAKLKHWPGAR